MSILKSIKGLVVKANDGSVNVEATAEKVVSAIVAEMESVAYQDTLIEKAVLDVFSNMGTNRAPTPVVISMAAIALSGEDLSQVGEWSKKVQDYLDRASGFKSQRGRKGGLQKV